MFIIFQFFLLKFYESRAIQQRIREVLHPIETPMPAVLKSHQATWSVGIERGKLGYNASWWGLAIILNILMIDIGDGIEI